MDCLLESNHALLQVVVAEACPRWLHVGPPCTFCRTISRWAAHATRDRWDDKRKSARTHWRFALHLLSLQEARGDKGSIARVCLMETWHDTRFPAGLPCVGMAQSPFLCIWNDASGYWCTLGQYAGVLLCNACLESICRPCVCTAPHGHIKGSIQGGPRHGERCPRGRIPATDVQLLGSDCEEAHARPLSTVPLAPQASLQWGLGFVWNPSFALTL